MAFEERIKMQAIRDSVEFAGALIINADDWGRNSETTDRTLDCVLCGAVSSVSAMVFMEDSERAAAIASERGIDAGLHLNFTTPFSAPGTPTRLMEHQRRLCVYLRRTRFSQAVYNPWLIRSFQYVATAQREEFQRLYGADPDRYDGHHHMHLSANILLGGLLPPNTVVRRNFSFSVGEKGKCNRLYRRLVDRLLARRHYFTDYFFSLVPLQPPSRLRTILSLACNSIVEVETHPVNPEEYQFLIDTTRFPAAHGDVPVAQRYRVARDRARLSVPR